MILSELSLAGSWKTTVVEVEVRVRAPKAWLAAMAELSFATREMRSRMLMLCDFKSA